MGEGSRRALTVRRGASVVVGGAVIWLTVAAFASVRPVDLTVALLVVLAEALGVAVLAGPMLSAAIALLSVVLVNWYLVPPYGTFEVSSADNVVSLIVFALVAIVAASLMEVGGRARQRAAESSRRTELLSDVVTVSGVVNTDVALDRMRTGIGLSYLELRESGDARSADVLARVGTAAGSPTLDITVADGYRLVGGGSELLAADPDFLASLGSAVVRAYEGEKLQAELRRTEELAAIDRARTALLASVGHDLRTPLATLRVGVDALRAPGGGLDEDDRVTLLATISASTDRLDDLISNLLDMSRLQAGSVIAQCVPVHLDSVVDHVELTFSTDRLDIRLPRDLPEIWSDPFLLERVIANLVANALRYSPSEAKVDLVAHRKGDHVVLEVLDRGPGLSPLDVDEVFTPFHRVGAQADGGSGLGLAIVKGFSEAMSIDVRLSPREGGGLSAQVMIPVAPVMP